MAVSIRDWTLEELNQAVGELVQQHLAASERVRGHGIRVLATPPVDRRSWDEVRASIRKNRFTPPEGSKTAYEMLREDRDNRYERGE